MSDKPSAFDTPDLTESPEAKAAAEAAAQAQTQPIVPVVPTIASDFVGEGKKYSTVEAALSSMPHAQSHIENLEAENARLREAAESATKLDDAISRIEANDDSTARPATPELDQATMREEARSVYQEINVEQAKKANVDRANNAVYDLYGDKAPEMTAKVAASLGVSVKFLEATAEQSPVAFMKLMTDNSSQGSGMPHVDQPTINSDAINNSNQQDAPSAKVGKSGSTKDLVSAWKGAGQIVADKNK